MCRMAVAVLVVVLSSSCRALYKDSVVSTVPYVGMHILSGSAAYTSDGVHLDGEELVTVWANTTQYQDEMHRLSLGYATPIQLCMHEPPGSRCGYDYPPSPSCVAHSPDCVCYNWRFAGASNATALTWRRHHHRPGCVVVVAAPPNDSMGDNYSVGVTLYWDLERVPGVPTPGLITMLEMEQQYAGAPQRSTTMPDIPQSVLDEACPVRVPLMDASGCFVQHTVVFRYTRVSEAYVEARIREDNQRQSTSKTIAVVSALAMGLGIVALLVVMHPSVIPRDTAAHQDRIDSMLGDVYGSVERRGIPHGGKRRRRPTPLRHRVAYHNPSSGDPLLTELD